MSKTEGVVLGDLLQQHERADREAKAIDFFITQTNSDEEEATYMLKKAGFGEQTIQQKVSGLSSGMRARLLFAIFIALGVNMLLLDEPTNHLDIEAVTALKEMLKKYTGIVLLVSHNRWFLEDLEIGSCYKVENSTIQKNKRHKTIHKNSTRSRRENDEPPQKSASVNILTG